MTGQEERDERPLTPCGNIVCTGCRVCGCPALGIAPQGARDDERKALARALRGETGTGGMPWSMVSAVYLASADRALAWMHAAGYRKHPEPEITDAAVEQRAKDMASASGWWWPTLGETGRLGRDGWRERARAELVRGGQA